MAVTVHRHEGDPMTENDPHAHEESPRPSGADALTAEALKLASAGYLWAQELISAQLGAGARAKQTKPDSEQREHDPSGPGEEAAQSEEHPHHQCTRCPLCKATAALKEASPVVAGHVAAAGISLLHAGSAVVDAWRHASSEPRESGRGPGAEPSRSDAAPRSSGSTRVEPITVEGLEESGNTETEGDSEQTREGGPWA